MTTHRNDRLLLAGDGLSAFGAWIDFLAILTLAAYQFHVTPYQMAAVSAAGLLPGILLAPAIGRRCDRGDPQSLLLASLVARAAATGAILFCHDFTLFVALVGLRSVAAMAATPAINVLAVRTIDDARRPQFYSLLNVLNNSAKVLAPAIGTVSSSLTSEAFALVVSLVFSALAFVAFACLRPPPRADAAAPRSGGVAPVPATGIAPLLWIAATYAFFVFAVNNLIPLVLQQSGLDKALLGILVSCAGAGSIVSGLWLARRRGGSAALGDAGAMVRPALVQAAAFGAIGLMLRMRAPHLDLLLPAIFFISGTLSARFAIALNVHMTTHFPLAIGGVSGRVQAWQNAMILVAPLLGAWVLDTRGAPALLGFAMLAAFASLGALGLLQALGGQRFAGRKKMPAGRMEAGKEDRLES